MAVSLKDFPHLFFKADGTPKEILCSQTKKDGYLFAVIELQDGTFMAGWEGHSKIAKDADELASLLNQHERTLFHFRVKG
jgi:hypothetical protein